MRPQRLLQTPELNLAIFAFLLNLAWEIWQVPFFRGMADGPHWLGVKDCTRAAFGDTGIALTAFWIAAVFARTRRWILRPRKQDIAIFVGAGMLATMLFETLATGPLARWAYTDAMPRVPISGTGFMPLLQWLVIPPLVLWFVGRQVDESSPGIGRKHEGR